MALPHAGRASPLAEGPTEAAVVAEARKAERWALLGVAIPAGAGVAFAMVTQPGGKTDVPTWQVATLGGLFGFAGLWGVSLGQYRAQRPLYATLTGVAKTGLLATAIAIERAACDTCDAPPLLTVGAIAGIVAWDVWEYLTLASSVRARAARTGQISAAPYLLPEKNRLVFGLATRF